MPVRSYRDRRTVALPGRCRQRLYLALGFAQATTTWQWPATDRWVKLLGGEPPEHWLPRSQWHLCWLLHDPEDAGHRQGFDEALDQGVADAELPGVAEGSFFHGGGDGGRRIRDQRTPQGGKGKAWGSSPGR